MASSSTARKGAPARKDQVPEPRSQDSKESAGRGGISMPAMGMPRIRIPGGTAGNVMWWGGLAALAAFGVVDWPVAALVAAGTWVAEQHARQSSHAQPGH